MTPAPVSGAAADVLSEINFARTSPREYASQRVEPMLRLYEGTLLKVAGRTPLRTNEGVASVEAALRFLRSAAPVPPLSRLSGGLCAAAEAHAADLGRTGGTGHDGSDGSTPFDRINRYGEWRGGAAENIAFLGDADARERVRWLILDDGQPSRPHRENIFNKEYTLLGVAEGGHPKFGCVQVSAASACVVRRARVLLS